jgi:hypothetical protein
MNKENRRRAMDFIRFPHSRGEVVVDLFVYVLRPLRLRSAIDYVELERLRQRDAGRRTLLRGWPFLPGWFLTADDFLARRRLLLVLLAPTKVLFLGIVRGICG